MFSLAVVRSKYLPCTVFDNEYEPPTKTDIIFTDLDDISNGAAYYYDNKIVIWALDPSHIPTIPHQISGAQFALCSKRCFDKS